MEELIKRRDSTAGCIADILYGAYKRKKSCWWIICRKIDVSAVKYRDEKTDDV